MQFLLQGMNIIPHFYFNDPSRREVLYFRATMVYYAMVESIVSPTIIMLMVRYNYLVHKAISRILSCCS